MNPAGELGVAARQLVTRGTQIAGWAGSSAWAVLGTLSRGIRTVARPAGVRGVALEAGVLAMHVVMYPWGALTEQRRPSGPYDCYRTDDLSPAKRGLVARYYVQRLGGDARVHTLVTLGTPHQGTMAAYLLPTQVLRQLRPDSDVMAELAAPSSRCRTRFVSLWSELDVFIVPQHNARLDHPDLMVTNYLLSDVGHLSFPVDPRAVHLVTSALAQLDDSPPADVAAADTIGPHPASAE